VKRNIYLLVCVIILSLLAIGIALPSFTFETDNQVITFDGLDPKDLGLSFITNEFAFQPSIDLQGGSIATINVDFTAVDQPERKAQMDLVKSSIYWRLWNARIDNFSLNVISGSDDANNKILIKAPSYLDESMLQFLMAPGNLSVWVEDTSTDNTTADGMQDYFKQIFGDRKPLNISNKNITSVDIVSDSRCYFDDKNKPKNYCIKITLDETGKSEFAAVLQENPNSQTPVVLAIDYNPIGVQAAGQYYNPADFGSDILIYTLSEDQKLINSILSSMISTEPLSQSVTIDKVENLKPILGEGTLNKIKIALFLGVLAVNALIIYYFKRRGIVFTLVFIMFIVWTIAILKMINAQLSLALLFGIMLAALVFISILISAEYKIRTAYKGTLTADELKEIYSGISTRVRNLTLALVVTDFVVGYYATSSIISFSTGLGAAMITALLVIILGFKALLPFLLLKK